jgi:hypothetical protein
MGIFDIVNDILYKKSGNLMEEEEFNSEFQPFMSQRWISMYSGTTTRILNATINKLYKGLDDKKQLYKLFLATIPKSKFKRISYIKKTSSKSSTPKTNMEEAMKLVAERHKISIREVKDYVENYGLDISKIVNSLKEK